MDLEHKAIERLKQASEMSIHFYQAPLLITASGGKDSDICLELAKRSGITYEVQHSLTTADAPQTVHHIKKQFYELELQGIKCNISYPMYKGKRTSMWRLIEQKKMPPTRIGRYCCEILKEGAGAGRMITTGVRWAESNKRKSRGVLEAISRNKDNKIILTNDNDDKRQLIEKCEMQAKTVCNPIIEWMDSDVWNYIDSEKIDVNPLYYCGFNRVGCVGCPMAGKTRYYEFRMFPKYQQNYIKAFERMLALKSNVTTWKTGEDVFRWWMEEDFMQLRFEDILKERVQ
ncbi:phosphoadenosine phosphosulfate reductase family protein [Paludicola sp. MB14-C6]|uniref:phosphoadenosine phosphosulfate reductase family protein n=1 Tax=Paludihabitans sp. MB14-C6 TaxID=3070656 RepID=UPI0027DB09A4|nr:phosphoadenosine phosphosulfate reductase family protein [Paludicola sp. MB14-C6]WMJ23478.1 phosphoadenosine phosphosulfate reductase family protein [Paludicola sp. MB14-C6]